MNNKALIEELSKVSETLISILEQLKQQQTQSRVGDGDDLLSKPRTLITDETVGDIQVGDSVIFGNVNDDDSREGFRAGVVYIVRGNDRIQKDNIYDDCPLSLHIDKDYHYVDHQLNGAILYKIEE